MKTSEVRRSGQSQRSARCIARFVGSLSEWCGGASSHLCGCQHGQIGVRRHHARGGGAVAAGARQPAQPASRWIVAQCDVAYFVVERAGERLRAGDHISLSPRDLGGVAALLQPVAPGCSRLQPVAAGCEHPSNTPTPTGCMLVPCDDQTPDLFEEDNTHAPGSGHTAHKPTDRAQRKGARTDRVIDRVGASCGVATNEKARSQVRCRSKGSL